MNIVQFVSILSAILTALAFGFWMENIFSGLWMFLIISAYQYNSDIINRVMK